MKKKWTAVLLCVLMVLQLLGTGVSASNPVYFTGAEENVLPLSDSTMPFWYNNYLYIPSSIFTGPTRAALGVGHTVDAEGKWVALYQNNSDKAILFREDASTGEDANGRLYYPGAIKRNGEYFVPAATIANYFGLKYSVTKVKLGWLVWIRSSGFILPDDLFADAATTMLEQRYQEYQKTKPSGNPQTILPPSVPELEIVSGKRIYLCMAGSERTTVWLDAMNRYDAWATVFCTPEFMSENHDLLRRIVAEGHGIGILADESLGIAVMDQVEAGNRELAQATGEKTRLVRVENSGEETMQALTNAGYCPDISRLRVSKQTLQSTTQANELFNSTVSSYADSVIWLGESVQISGLNFFLTRVVQSKEICLPLTEVIEIS